MWLQYMSHEKNKIGKLGSNTLLAVACLTIMVGCVIVPGLPNVAKNLGVSGFESWLVTLPSLGVVLFGYWAGQFIDRYGAYFSLCIGLFLYGIFGLAAIFLHGVIPVFIDRLLLGGATALVMASGTGLISEFYDGHARLAMIAKQGMAIELGGVIFLFIGGIFASIHWQLPFLLYFMAWIFLILIWFFVPKINPSITSTSLSQLSERNHKNHIVYLAAIFSMILFFTGVITLPEKLFKEGLDEAQTGYFLSYVSLIAVFAAYFMPKLVKKVGEFRGLFIAFICYGFAHFCFSTTNLLMFEVVGATFLGMGFGFSIPLVNHMIVERSHAQQRGKNLAQLAMAIFLGQFLASFMSFIPGGNHLIFAVAATISIIVSLRFLIKSKSF
jgi:MFS family permease